ncbi:MAG: transposase [Chromatiaceae bacterium]|nr:transposase [Chromatiaceae bacterium]MBP6733790.1 transposase [Chromatiaceae bacterium]MBP8283072.1 transposase [Chromatiaceae bacterium]MBP8289228.1 transposase [Chromatiaceae bacterium]
MDTNCKSRLSQFWNHLQHELFPFLREEDHLALSPALEQVIRVLEFTQIERFIPSNRGCVGRPPQDRVALARAFIAKAVLDLPTTEALIDRLQADRSLRRIGGFARFHAIPDASRFSRAFAEFTAWALPARVHEALIRAQLGDQIIGHIARDSTEIEAREQPAPKVVTDAPAAPPGLFDAVVSEAAPAAAAPAPANKRGRPRKGEERVKEPTVIERQVGQSVAESLAQLPTACDVGSKKNSKGFKETWTGYKLLIDTADGDIPVTAILTSASMHDSQAAIPLMRLTGERVTYLYDLADAADCSGVIRAVSRQEGHVPLIDHHARRGEKIEFAPHEAQRYKARSQAERVNSLLKDNHGGRHVRVRGAPKVYTHLMFGILVIAAEQLLRLLR